MTVKELKEYLNKFPDGMRVVTTDDFDGRPELLK